MPEENILDPNMDIVIIIDKDGLPEELRNKLPQDLQNILEKLLQEKTTSSPLPQSNLFAVQHGTVVGNIYKDGIAPEETLIKTKIRQESNNIYQEQDKNIPIQDKKAI